MAVLYMLLLIATLTSASQSAAEAGITAPDDWRRSHRQLTRDESCRLMAKDPYLSNIVRQLTVDRTVHLIKYSLKFPDDFDNNITGS